MMLQLGDTLFCAGDVGTSLYIVLSGELGCLSAINSQEVNVLKPGGVGSLYVITSFPLLNCLGFQVQFLVSLQR